jgi:hypothetical protein
VDNLGAQNLLLFLLLRPAKLPFIHIAGDRRFNRSSPSPELRFTVPVEKIGSDFHRLAMPACPKSPIRSFPKYESGIVPLGYYWYGR